MAKIKHIAIRTRDVDQTAAFYKDAFDLTQVGMGKTASI
jgi:catechol 2,3-dioxygenase-like lactoylglutathione lyase family enzyme